MVTELPSSGNEAALAIAQAEREIAQEKMKKGIERLKVKLRERDSAKAVLDNVNREIEDLKLQIEHGNI